jgi:chromosome segregation ATPase
MTALSCSDDAVPVREHLERLIADHSRRFDDLRAADKAAIDAALAASIKAIEAALAATERATRAAFDAAERRLADSQHSVERSEDAARATREYTEAKNNEFRGQLADQAASFMPRTEADSRNQGLQRQLDEQRSSTQKALDELRRLVWIAVGLAMAASVAIPLLLRK